MKGALSRYVAATMAIGVAYLVHATDPAREVHGSGDAYSAPGVALAWGILRNSDESKTLAVVRVVTDPSVYRSVAVAGVDPFTSRRKTMMNPTDVGGAFDVPLPRPSFADLPRTEFRFFRTEADAQADAPALVVYFLGVPDTAPELTNAAALDKYLSERIARAQKGTP